MSGSLICGCGLLLLVAGCGPTGAGSPPDASPPAPTAIVEVQVKDDLTFSPAMVTIARGAAVRWVNGGSAGHTVTSGSSSQAADNPGSIFDQNLARGASFQYTFNTVGNQPYFCRIHERMNMKGLVVVTP